MDSGLETEVLISDQPMKSSKNTLENALSTFNKCTLEVQNIVKQFKTHFICPACEAVFNRVEDSIHHYTNHCRAEVMSDMAIWSEISTKLCNFVKGIPAQEVTSVDPKLKTKGKRRYPFQEVDNCDSEVLRRCITQVFEAIDASDTSNSGCDDFEKTMQKHYSEDLSSKVINSEKMSTSLSPEAQQKPKGTTQRQRLEERNDCTVDDSSFKCVPCDQEFANIKTLNQHMRIRHDRIREMSHCPLCEKMYETRSGLHKHLSSIHSLSKEQVRNTKFTTSVVQESPPPLPPSSPPPPTPPQSSSSNESNNKIEGTVYLCSCGQSSFENEEAILEHRKTCEVQLKDLKPDTPFSHFPSNRRPVRIGVKKQIGKEFVNSQTVNFRFPKSRTSPNQTKSKKVNKIAAIPKSKSKIDPQKMENAVNLRIDFEKKQCKVCNKLFKSTSNVRRHVALHLGWTRYNCSLCPHKKLKSRRSTCAIQSPKVSSVEVKCSKSASKPKVAESVKENSKSSSTLLVNVYSSNTSGSKDTKISQVTQSKNELSTLVTRSGMYHKEDKLQRLNDLTTKLISRAEFVNSENPSVDENADETSSMSAVDQPVVHVENLEKNNEKCPSGNQESSTSFTSSRRKKPRIKYPEVYEKQPIRSSLIPSFNNLLCNSSDEGEKEQRISKRKQSLSKLRFDNEEEIYLDHVSSPKKSNNNNNQTLSSSYGMINYKENAKMYSHKSKSNPNSPQRSVCNASPKFVISDEQGRFVKEELQKDSSPKKSPSKIVESVQSVPSILCKALDFSDSSKVSNSRRHSVSLLRKHRTICNTISSENDSSVSAINEVLKSTSEKSNMDTQLKNN
ncbi:hypothetical protein GQR58_024704 [Nymphon striatum]|nr:hypothetical protein GQR58_024704 [Nymphon striatum]